MSDSILDLSACGTETIFRLKPDWATRPALETQFGRDVLQYDRGAMKYRPLTAATGWKISLGFTNLTRKDGFDLLTFFNDRKGMLERFWYPVPWNYFRLAADITAGDTTIALFGDGFREAIPAAYTRLFIQLRNGDLITRQINSVSFGSTEIDVASPIDRDIAVDDIAVFGRLILCRFDQDELQLSHAAPAMSSTEIGLQEIAQDYEPEGT